jgi:hypothetical protein
MNRVETQKITSQRTSVRTGRLSSPLLRELSVPSSTVFFNLKVLASDLLDLHGLTDSLSGGFHINQKTKFVWSSAFRRFEIVSLKAELQTISRSLRKDSSGIYSSS